MLRYPQIIGTALVAFWCGEACAQELVVNISLETTAAPGGRLRYDYLIENLPESEMTVNSFLLDVADGADILEIEHPLGWYGEYAPEEVSFDMLWLAQGPQFEIPIGGSGTFSFTSPLEPAPIFTYIANLTPEGEPLGEILDEFDGPALPPTGGIPGDYNDSGLVEQGDLDLVLGNWGSDMVPGTWVNDPPEGIVDQAELDQVLGNWGRNMPGQGTAAAVPEPATVMMLILAAAIGATWRRAARPKRAGA